MHDVDLTSNGKEIKFKLSHHPLFEKHGVYIETEVIDAMTRFIQPGDFVVDGGANVGVYSLILSRLVGGGGMVMAVEPDPANCIALHRNIALNNVSNIFCIQNALWSEDCFKEFFPVELFSASSSFTKYEKSFPPIQVFARKLDTLLTSSPLFGHPRLIKLDCEGAELEIIRGGTNVLKDVECLIVEFHFPLMEHNGLKEHEIREQLHSLGYDCFIKAPTYEPRFMPLHCRMAMTGDGMKDGDGHCNMMFARTDKVRQLWPNADFSLVRSEQSAAAS